MNLPQNVKYIIETIEKNNFEAFAVGGCVRDSLMGVEPKDYDITTNALPEQVKVLFSKTIETGIEHGTITVVLDGENFEVTTYRIDGEYLDNRRPDKVVFTPNLKEDLLRRDFTINAIAYNDTKGYQDFFNGQEHIKEKKIIAVGSAEKRFDEDSLRIYRGVRFACQLGFEIDEETKIAMKSKAELTQNLSVERIREELVKALKSLYIENLKTFIDIDVLRFYDDILSEHVKNDLDKIIKNLNNIERTNTNVLATLFFGLSLDEVKKQLKKLKLDNKTINEVYTILEYINVRNEDNFYFTRKALSKYGEFFKTMLYVQEILTSVDNSSILKNVNTVLANNEPINIKDLVVNGKDMQEAGFSGVQIGEKLNFLLDEVHKNPELNTKEQLLALLQ